MNFIFIATQFELHCPRLYSLNGLTLGMTLGWIKHPKIFQQLLSQAEISHMMSKAAAHCLQYLCDMSLPKQEAKRFLASGYFDKQKRKTCPWKWRKRRCCDLTQNRILAVRWWRGRCRLSLFTYGRLLWFSSYWTVFHFYPVHSFKWTQWAQWESRENFEDVSVWYKYLSVLEHLPALLAHAGSFTPLIHLCQTKSFGPLSMMFPVFSRRARHAITKYLERVTLDT